MYRLVLPFGLCLLTGVANSQDKNSVNSGRFVAATRCADAAAEYHKVNPAILKAILKVESGGNPLARNLNANGTEDIGIGQYNSSNLKALSPFGVDSRDLYDSCVGTYVSAWHLAKQVKAYGNTWFAIGAYHSTTPFFNKRYQALINNAMVDLGFANWPKTPIAPLSQATVSRNDKASSVATSSDGLVAETQ